MSPHEPIVYVALGDSTGVGVGARGGGYPARLADRAGRAGWRVRLVNACVSGARVAHVVADQLATAVAARPRVVTVGVGINDATWGTAPAAFRRDYAELAEALAATGARVLVVNVPDLSPSPLVPPGMQRAFRERIDVVNAAIATCARRHGFGLVDLSPVSATEMQRSGLLSDDLFHPSEDGYERLTDLVHPGFEAALRASGPPPAATLSTAPPLS